MQAVTRRSDEGFEVAASLLTLGPRLAQGFAEVQNVADLRSQGAQGQDLLRFLTLRPYANQAPSCRVLSVQNGAQLFEKSRQKTLPFLAQLSMALQLTSLQLKLANPVPAEMSHQNGQPKWTES